MKRSKRWTEQDLLAVQGPPNMFMVGVAVKCTVCGLIKCPRGRSMPIGASYCDHDCPGWSKDPQVGDLWPGETNEEFGYPCSRTETVTRLRLTPPKPPIPAEADVLRAVQQYLSVHPAVEMSWRQASGKGFVVRPLYDGSSHPFQALRRQLDACVAAGLLDPRQVAWLEWGWVGASDVGGILKGDGRYLAVEVKRPGKKPDDAQVSFLDRVNVAGGLGVCVDDVQQLADVLRRA